MNLIIETSLHRISRSKGFTLLEVLVVMFIAGISMGAIGLSLNVIINKRVLVSEAFRLNKWLSHVHQYAIVSSKTYLIFVDDEKNSLSIQEYKNSNWSVATLDRNKFKITKEIKTKLSFDENGEFKFLLFPDSTYTPFNLELMLDKENNISINGDGVKPPEIKDKMDLS